MIKMKKNNIFIYLLVIIFFLIAILRLVYLNMVEKPTFKEKLIAKTEIIVNGSSAPRGRIIDTTGKVIVDNKGINTIYYNKIKGITLKEELDIALRLASIIDIKKDNIEALKKYWLILHNNGESLITDEEYELLRMRKITMDEINKKIDERIPLKDLEDLSDIEKEQANIYYLMNNGFTYQKKLILNNPQDEAIAKIVEEEIPGITIEVNWEREYLYGNVMRSILGSIGSIPVEEKDEYLKNGYELTDIVGRSYLEKEYEDYLKGEKGIYKVNKDNTLTLIKEPKKGNDLVLNIDIELQEKVEEILKDKILFGKKNYANTEYYKESYALVSNPLTGDILAMAGQRLNDDGSFSDVATNNITNTFTIGSAVKGATIGVGYKYNLIEAGKYITDGCVKLYFVPAKCSHKRLGRINDLDALAKSSNYFQFLIAINLTGNKYKPNMQLNATEEHFNIYRNMLASFGLGAKTNIDLPNEVEGIKGSEIADDLLLNLSIGQYDTYTPVEVIQYVNSVASGKRMNLNVMQKIMDNDDIVKERDVNVLNEVDLNNEYLDRIRLGMNKVLLEGTGKGYVPVELNPVGKTGTSETFIDANGDGKMDVATITSTFAGFFPKDNPKYSVVVITPNISHKNGVNDTMYFGARRITNEITTYLANK